METSGILTLFCALTKQNYVLSFSGLDWKSVELGSPSSRTVAKIAPITEPHIRLGFYPHVYQQVAWELFYNTMEKS